MTQPALRLLLKICQRQRRNEDGEGGRRKKPYLLLFLFYPNMGLFSFGYLNKLPDRGEKGPRILISCCCGKVNERGAAGEAGRVLHHGAFYDCPPAPHARTLSLQGRAVFTPLGTRQEIWTKAGCVCYRCIVTPSIRFFVVN